MLRDHVASGAEQRLLAVNLDPRASRRQEISDGSLPQYGGDERVGLTTGRAPIQRLTRDE
jgi:hypothetical protein